MSPNGKCFGCGINRFQFCAMLSWSFTLFFGTQMIFSIYSIYIPRWKCLETSCHTSQTTNYTTPISNHTTTTTDPHIFSRDCAMYKCCPLDQVAYHKKVGNILPIHESWREIKISRCWNLINYWQWKGSDIELDPTNTN